MSVPAGTASPTATPAQIGALLTALYRYLVAQAPTHALIAAEIPVLRGAAVLYGAKNLTAALSTGTSVYQAIVTARQTDPGLPLP